MTISNDLQKERVRARKKVNENVMVAKVLHDENDVNIGHFNELFADRVNKFCKRTIKKVLMVNPPGMSEVDFDESLAFSRRYWCYPPYGIAILSERLKEAGFSCDILDLNFCLLKSVIDKNDKLSYQEKIDGFIEKKIQDVKPDIVGISVMFTMSDLPMQYLISKFSAMGIPVIIGGIHPTNDTTGVLERNNDIFFLGRFESDETLPRIFSSINKYNAEPSSDIFSDVKNIAFSEKGKIFQSTREVSPALNKYGIPDYCDLPIDQYSKYGQVGTYHFLRSESRAASSILAKRGCRAQCTFCSVRSFNGLGVRSRETEIVLDEIKSLYSQGIKHFTWLDDDLLYGSKQTMELLTAISELNLDITWDASNGLIAGALNVEILQAMVDSGCVGFNLGIESGSDRILKSVKKPGNCAAFLRASKLINQFPQLFVKGFLMMGFPGETLSEMRKTIILANDLNHDWYPIQILNPLPSTKIISSVAEAGQMGSHSLEDKQKEGTNFTAGVFSTLRLKRAQEKSDNSKLIGSEGDSIAHEKIKKSSLSNKKEFKDFFSEKDFNEELIPHQTAYADIWFSMDYYINYKPIFDITNPDQLRKKELILEDITNRITRDNPLGLFFLAEVQEKIGKHEAAKESREKAKEFRDKSEFWDSRMTAFSL